MSQQPITTQRQLRTKIQIIESRLQVARDLVTDYEAELNAYKALPAGAPKCQTCGQPFETDHDFWSHYLVPDERLTNIGACPTKFEA